MNEPDYTLRELVDLMRASFEFTQPPYEVATYQLQPGVTIRRHRSWSGLSNHVLSDVCKCDWVIRDERDPTETKLTCLRTSNGLVSMRKVLLRAMELSP